MSKYLGMIDGSADRIQKSTQDKVAGYYSTALKDINSSLAEFDRKGVLTQNQMLQYGRLKSLEDQVTQEIGKVTGKAANTVKSGLGNLYEDTYYRSGFMFEKEVGAKLSFSRLNPRIAKEMAESPFDRVGWLKRSRQNQARLTEQLKQEIFTGLTQGKGYRDIARTVKNRMDIGATNMDRIVRTEGHRVRESAKLDSMKHAEKQGVVAKKRWLATLAGNTRDSHARLDGETIAVDENFQGDYGTGLAPGQLGDPKDDINCRCTLITVIEGFEPEQRRIQGDEVVPYTNYEDWKKARIDGEDVPLTKEAIFNNLENRGVRVDSKTLEGLDEKLITENAAKLDELFEQFPQIQEEFGTFSFGGTKYGNEIAHLRSTPLGSDHQRMNLVRKHYLNYDNFIEERARDVASGFHVPVAPSTYSTAVVNHEFGHLVHNVLGKRFIKANPNHFKERAAKALHWKTKPAASKKILNKIHMDLVKPLNEEIIAIARKSNPSLKMADVGSRYGVTNHQEWFAEAFSNATGGQPNEIGKAMLEFLRREL